MVTPFDVLFQGLLLANLLALTGQLTRLRTWLALVDMHSQHSALSVKGPRELTSVIFPPVPTRHALRIAHACPDST